MSGWWIISDIPKGFIGNPFRKKTGFHDAQEWPHDFVWWLLVAARSIRLQCHKGYVPFCKCQKGPGFQHGLRPVGSDKRESCLETTMTQWNTMRFAETWVPSKVAKRYPLPSARQELESMVSLETTNSHRNNWTYQQYMGSGSNSGTPTPNRIYPSPYKVLQDIIYIYILL